tara:strand:- start:302 stop:631 length:330 start_codon:yes stop_codon:yes gene_type:complete
MKDDYKVTITDEQAKELAQLSYDNHHTEAMKKLTKWVLMGLAEQRCVFNPTNMDILIQEAQSRYELMSTIEHLHNKFNHLTDTCNDVRYELMNKTLACIKNEKEIRGCL